MTQKRKSLIKDKRGFTGLEAAIVLTAFVVVAAVFSYMVLNMGFFSTETAKGVIQSGVESSSSALETSGGIIAKEGSTTDTVGYILVTLTLASGGNPIDIGASNTDNKLTVSYADESVYAKNTSWSRDWVVTRGTSDDMLDYGEKVELNITVPASARLLTNTTSTDCDFTLNIKPAVGSILVIPLMTPSNIDDVMILSD